MYSTSNSEKAYTVNVALGEISTTMVLDTGSAVSVVSEDFYQKNLSHFILKPAPGLKLKYYSGQNIAIRGCVTIPVQYETQKAALPLVVVKGSRPALMGRN